MNKKFFENPIVKKWVPEEIARWLDEIVVENFKDAGNKWGRWKVKYKAQHTLKVMRWGNKILKNLKETEWNKKQAIIICFLHDTGRFPQVKQNSYSDIDTGIDHASLGAKMISELSFDWKNNECNKAEIIEAIMWHSRKDYLGENPYAKFVRDADKLACFEDWMEMEKDADDRKLIGVEINPLVWELLENKEPIGNELVTTKAEWVLNIASWLWNINYEATKKETVKMEIDKILLEEFRKNKNPKEEVERLQKNLEEFRKTV
jgi:hypothetical protein